MLPKKYILKEKERGESLKEEIICPPSEEEMEKELKEDGLDLAELNEESVPESVMSGYKWYTAHVLRYEDMIPREEQIQLTREYKETHSKEIKDRLVLANQRLVNKIAAKYEGLADMEDLCQEGTMGLMRAIDMFEPDKGYQLSTYATWWIRQGITRYLANQGSNIRIPVHLQDDIKSFQNTVRKMKESGIVEPTIEELVKHTGFKEDKIKTILRSITLMKTASLSARVGEEEGDGELVDFIRDPGKSVEDQAMDDITSKDLYADLRDLLSEREYDVICRRTGTGQYQYRQTLNEIGEEYNITRERVRQIEEKALRKASRSWRFRKAWAK